MSSKLKFLILIFITNLISINGDDITNDKSDVNESDERFHDGDEVDSEEYFNSTDVNQDEYPEALGLRNDTDSFEDEGNQETPAPDYVTTYNDVYDNMDHNTTNVETDTTTQMPTTKAMDDEEETVSKMPDEEDEQVTAGQRNPKTESAEQPPHDNRIFPSQPIPTQSSKSSTLRSWLEDSWLRPPAAILVPLRPMALNRALAVWNDLMVEGLNVSDIVIVGYDSTGINWGLRHNLQPSTTGEKSRAVAEALSKLILKYQGVNSDTASDGTMRALALAAKLVPYDSALFVITDKGAGDPQRLPVALRTLVDKRLKVYTIWTKPSDATSETDDELLELRNISQHTEGDVLPYSMQVMDMEDSNLASDGDLHWDQSETKQGRQGRVNNAVDFDRYDKLLVRRGGGEAISLGLTVENGVTALRILIEGAVEHAVLYPPNDAPQIDLYNTTSVSLFSTESKTENLSPRDVYLIFPGSTADVDTLSVLPANEDPQPGMVGVWHLSVRCDTCDYRLCIMARARIHFDVFSDGTGALKLRVTGPVASVRETLVVDEYGTELAKLPFSYQPMVGDDPFEMIDPSTELTGEAILPDVKGSKIYVKIVGRDVKGEPFVRLAGPLKHPDIRTGRSASIVFLDSINDLDRAEEDNLRASQKLLYNNSALITDRSMPQAMNQRGLLLTTVQIGLGTRLYGAPGDNLQLHFEVTNYREQAVRFSFEATGELRFLTGINPATQVVASGQTVNVIVSATVSSTAQPGVRDLVTFTAYGLDTVSISAYIYVVTSLDSITDVWAPEVRHNFQGTCIGRMGSDCAQHIWSTTVIARDSNSGLLRLFSTPIGLLLDNFISGTREEVTATYRATCCAPRIVVSAVDVFGNTNSYIVDISGYLSDTAIAAIVLGVILVILLIALLIYLIYICVKRRKESRELPYTTSSRNVN